MTTGRRLDGLRLPLAALAVAVGVLLVAFALDTGSPRQRDAALVIGSLALYGLLPLAVLWLLVAAVRRGRHRR